MNCSLKKKRNTLEKAATETGGCSTSLTPCELLAIGFPIKFSIDLVSESLQQQFDSESIAIVQIYGIYMQSLIKLVHFALGFYEALLGFLNPLDKEVCVWI